MTKRTKLQIKGSLFNQTRRAIAILLLSLLPTNSFAGLETLVKNVFPSGTMSNVTKGAITKEQEGGHLTGGSVIIKTPKAPKKPKIQKVGLPQAMQDLLNLPVGSCVSLTAPKMLES